MVRKEAEFSECRKYRYTLWRVWSEGEPLVMFIGLNPYAKASDGHTPSKKPWRRMVALIVR
jgi:hypothetical protein